MVFYLYKVVVLLGEFGQQVFVSFLLDFDDKIFKLIFF